MQNELKPNRSGNYHHNGNPKHGLYRDNAALFNVWQTMKSRCENPNRTKYKDYGGRGIKVCDEWHEASKFVLWALSHGYKKGLQLDRVDNDGDYCPENCRFVTPKENSRNRRNTKRLTVNGETKTIVEWCEQLGANQYTVYYWIREKGITYAERKMSEIARVPVLRGVKHSFGEQVIEHGLSAKIITSILTEWPFHRLTKKRLSKHGTGGFTVKIEIEIPDDELKEMLTKVISERLYDDYSCDRNLYKRTIAECVREVIYKDKEAIVDRIVVQAGRECRTKAIKKLLEESK